MGASVSVPKTTTVVNVTGNGNTVVTGTSVPTVPTITNPITTEMNPVSHNLDAKTINMVIQMLHDPTIGVEDLMSALSIIDEDETFDETSCIDQAGGTGLYKSGKKTTGQINWTSKLNSLMTKSLSIMTNISTKGIDCRKTDEFKRLVQKVGPIVLEHIKKTWSKDGYAVRSTRDIIIPDAPYVKDDQKELAAVASRMFLNRAELSLTDIANELNQLILYNTPSQAITNDGSIISRSDAMMADRLVCPGGTSLAALVSGAEAAQLGAKIEVECAADLAAATGSTPCIAVHHPDEISKTVFETARETGDIADICNEVMVASAPYGYEVVATGKPEGIADLNAIQHTIDNTYVDGITAQEIENNKREFNRTAIHNIAELLVTPPDKIPQSQFPRSFANGQAMSDAMQSNFNNVPMSGFTAFYATSNKVPNKKYKDAISTDDNVVEVEVTHISNNCYSRAPAYDGFALTLTCIASVVGRGFPVILFKSSFSGTDDIYALRGHRNGLTSTYNFSLPLILTKPFGLFGTASNFTFGIADGQEGDAVCFDDARIIASRDDRQRNIGHYIFNGVPTKEPLINLIFKATASTLITNAPLDAFTIWSELCARLNPMIPNAVSHITDGKMHLAVCAFAELMDVALVEPPINRKVTPAEAEEMMIGLINEIQVSFQYNGGARLAEFREEHIPKVVYRTLGMIYHAARAYVYSDTSSELGIVAIRNVVEAAELPAARGPFPQVDRRKAAGGSPAVPWRYMKMLF